MSTPIPIPSNTDMTFLVKWDTNFVSKFYPQSYYLGQYLLGGYIVYIDSTGQHGLIAPDYNLVDTNGGGGWVWSQALNVCNSFVANGYTDWRMGTITEMSRIDINQIYIPNFVPNYYWSATLFDASNAYNIGMSGTGIDINVELLSFNSYALPIKSF